jgi:phosphatidylglycerophosphate synthase
VIAGSGGKGVSFDGLVSRAFNRPISRRAAALLAHTPVSPNQVTIVSTLIALAAGLLLWAGHNVWAGLCIHASSVVDGVDGDLARRTGRTSRFGGVLDAVLDRYADAAIIAGMAWWALHHEGYPGSALVGIAALTGAFSVSYSRARAEASAGIPLSPGFFGLASRDVRLFLAAIGCVVGQVYATLVLIAVLSNATVLWRLLYLRRELSAVHPADHDPDLTTTAN